MHPNPPTDAVGDRDPSTGYLPSDEVTHNLAHPASLDPCTSCGPLARGTLVNAVQRHKHQVYCQRQPRGRSSTTSTATTANETGTSAAPVPPAPAPATGAQQQQQQQHTDDRCRFAYPKARCSKTHVVVNEYEVKTRGGQIDRRVMFEVIPERNDQWINSHMPYLLEVWKGNMDMRLTIDLGQIVSYMTKYVTKTESAMTPSARRMVRRIMQQGVDDGLAPQAILKKTMSKLMGERAIAKQESCHLMMSRPTVTCSHSFVRVNLDNNVRQVLLEEPGGDDNVPVDEGNVTRMTLVDAYSCCLDSRKWASENEYLTLRPGIETKSLVEFCQAFSVPGKGPSKNKIKANSASRKQVYMFWPQFSSERTSPNYGNYCRTALLKYKPWAGQVNFDEFLWGNNNPSDEDYCREWENFLTSFANHAEHNPTSVPDFLRREIEMLQLVQQQQQHSGSATMTTTADIAGIGGDGNVLNDGLINPDDLEREDWQDEANDHFNLDDIDLLTEHTGIQWSEDHDWSQLMHEYNVEGFNFQSASDQYQAMLSNNAIQETEPVTKPNVRLNFLQKIARDMILEMVRSDDPDKKLGVLIGKGGTGKSTSIGMAEYILEQEFGTGCVLKLAPTGKAASVINGSTLHSHQTGLGLPIGRQAYKKLGGAAKQRYQTRFEKIKLVVIDEYSMLKQRELFYIDQTLRDISAKNVLFGGYAVLLVGDPAQIPPVLGRELWKIGTVRGGRACPSLDDEQGLNLYTNCFNSVVQLTEVRRVDQDSEDASLFLEILDRLRDGLNTESDWKIVKNKCSHHSMPAPQWENRFGETTNDVTRIFFTNVQVDDYNIKRLGQLSTPIALILARHNNRECNSFPPSFFRQLPNSLYLAVGAKVVMTQNVCQSVGLVNGATGVVKDIVYMQEPPPGEELQDRAPNLPWFVWVDFGSNYKGPPFFPPAAGASCRRGWVPVHPVTINEKKRSGAVYKEYSRTMLPLRLAYAWTPWKAQGQTFTGKIVADLGKSEREHGLTYTIFSRVTAFANLGIDGGLTLDRFTKSISTHEKMEPRKLEERRLAALSETTVQRLRTARRERNLAARAQRNVN
jgi:hypothetical protein